MNVGSTLTQYDQCQVGQLICSGSVQTNSGTTLVGSLACHHVARRRNFTLATNLVVSLDAAGPSLTGGIHPTATETATSIDRAFDGSQFILIRKFFPIDNGFLVLALRLDVSTGTLTAQ